MKGLRRNKIKRCVWIFLSFLFFLCACAQTKKQESMGDPEVKITFFDVGKGDAILIETDNNRMLIDSGYDNTSPVILDYLDSRKIEKLDYMVLTHFDKDHVGGADKILDEVQVGMILQPDYQSNSSQTAEYCTAMEQKGMQPVKVTETMHLFMDGADILIYPPQQKEYEEEDNDFSLVISMTYQEKRFLFAGDCESVRLQELLEQTEFELSHDVLKVPHHGKKEKNSEEFLEAVSPNAAIITCSEEMPADKRIVSILEEQGATVYQTVQGSITCLCSGDEMQIIQ